MSIGDVGLVTAIATALAIALFQSHWARSRRIDP
jgi:hypothetical protein